jgi:menaquinone-dependent protoporphyrinogen oxidase
MSQPILIGYASKYGSTKEVAEVIADVVRDSGLVVELRPLSEVRTLEPYRAVVMGAALYVYHWHKDAHKFLSRHREALSWLPVYVFALGPIHDVEQEFADARQQLEKDLAKESWFRPADLRLFAGKYDPATLPFPINKMAGKEPASDARDWDAIRAWAGGVAQQLAVAAG